MNKYLSCKLRIISFISIVLVVFLHSYKTVMKFHNGDLGCNNGYALFIQLFCSEGIARIAVPLFFCISGYLFFLKLNGSSHEFILKYKKRARSLVVPYLLWSLWGLFFYFTLQLFPASAKFFTNGLIVNYSLTKILTTLFLNPIPYQLWFLRDLILLTLISPVIYCIIRYSRLAPIALLFITWLGLFEVSFLIFRTESAFFFCLGAYLAIHKPNLPVKKTDQKGYLVFVFLWIVAVTLKTIFIYQGSEQMTLILLLGKLSILSGIVALWSLYDMAMKNKTHPGETTLYLSSFSFFIYGFHEPTLTIIQKGLFYVTGATEIMAVFNYILAPVFTLIISIALAHALKRYLPLFYGLITGGR